MSDQSNRVFHLDGYLLFDAVAWRWRHNLYRKMVEVQIRRRMLTLCTISSFVFLITEGVSRWRTFYVGPT